MSTDDAEKGNLPAESTLPALPAGDVAASEDVPEVPREEMVSTAVKFLQNPKVRQSPFAQRRAFLEKKGLTKVEIDTAIQRSGTAQDEHAPPVAPVASATMAPGQAPAVVAVPQPGYQAPALAPQPVPVSSWAKLRDFLSTVLVLGGGSYAVYKFYQRYIAPKWFGPTEQQLSDIHSSVAELQANISETLQKIGEMQTTVNKQQVFVEEMVKTNAANRGSNEIFKMQDSQYVNEIKEEIKSLKGLLLSRKQFPSTPVTQPVIPSWQLTASKSTDTTTTTTESTSLTTSTDAVIKEENSGSTDTIGASVEGAEAKDNSNTGTPSDASGTSASQTVHATGEKQDQKEPDQKPPLLNGHVLENGEDKNSSELEAENQQVKGQGSTEVIQDKADSVPAEDFGTEDFGTEDFGTKATQETNNVVNEIQAPAETVQT